MEVFIIVKEKSGFFLENETYSAYFFEGENGYFYEENHSTKKRKRISSKEYENRLEEKYNC